MRSHNQETKYELVIKIDDEESESPTQVIESLISSIDQKLDKFVNSSSSYAASIYRVSQKLRKENEAAYTPRFVSIGPLHRDLAQLQGAEHFKLKFLHNFLSRFGIGLHTLVQFAAKEESFVRGCYEGKVEVSPKRLTEVILLDGIFIVELFLENRFVSLRDKNEIIFENHLVFNDLLHDLMLLENQLPLSIMESLLSFVNISFLNEGMELSIYDLAQNFFKDVGNTGKVVLTERYKHARHFLEFLLFLHAPENKMIRGDSKKPRKRGQLSAARKFEYTRSATELQEAGVKFRSGEGNCLFDVVFSGGVLTIPKLTVNDSTGTFLLNIVALEHLGRFGYLSRNITSYVILMDGFINTPADVDLLSKHNIIDNRFGESQQVADLFNNLYKEVVAEANNFYFAGLCEELNEYSRDRFHQWKARCFNWRVMLGREYFSNPWSCISLFAAIALLLLTVTQTVCSILQV